jgi:hypothetical protein
MAYSFARINAGLEMKVRDYFVQGPPRPCIRQDRVLDCDGRGPRAPCCLFRAGAPSRAGIAGDEDGPLSPFRPVAATVSSAVSWVNFSMWIEPALPAVSLEQIPIRPITAITAHPAATG